MIAIAIVTVMIMGWIIFVRLLVLDDRRERRRVRRRMQAVEDAIQSRPTGFTIGMTPLRACEDCGKLLGGADGWAIYDRSLCERCYSNHVVSDEDFEEYRSKLLG